MQTQTANTDTAPWTRAHMAAAHQGRVRGQAHISPRKQTQTADTPPARPGAHMAAAHQGPGMCAQGHRRVDGGGGAAVPLRVLAATHLVIKIHYSNLVIKIHCSNLMIKICYSVSRPRRRVGGGAGVPLKRHLFINKSYNKDLL